MKRVLALLLVIAACTTTTDEATTTTATSSTVPAVEIQVIPPPDGPTVIHPAPDLPTADVSAATEAAAADVLSSALLGAVEQEAVDQLIATGDPRVAWLIADLLRFFQTGQTSLSLATAFTRLTGAPIDNDGQPYFVPAFDNLFAWDLPAWDGYADLKRQLYTVVEPAWDPFFTENVSMDWRLVTWGGVLIDDRSYPATEPCFEGCIPALDDPPTTEAERGDWYPDDAVVFGVVVGDEAVALPKNQMEVHEMVNMTIGGERLGIPYCTLCGSAQAYLTDTVPAGFDTAILRTSGLLSRSNKVMYDLISGSVFDTFTGEARTGPLAEAGATLKQVTVVTSLWGDWKQAHPDTRIIARDAGIGRLYDLNPLGDRDAEGPIFPVGPVDPRLSVHDKVLGVVHDGEAIAFAISDLQDHPDTEITVEGLAVVPDGAGYRVTAAGTEVTAHESFWFAWSQFHPDTLLVRLVET